MKTRECRGNSQLEPAVRSRPLPPLLPLLVVLGGGVVGAREDLGTAA